MRHLASLFSHIDQDLINCWSGPCSTAGTSVHLPGIGTLPTTRCGTLTASRAAAILQELSGPSSVVFEGGVDGLTEVQKADLLITWQWLRNRVWRLAQGHGLTHCGATNEDAELGTDYPVDVALTTVGICKRLSLEAMEAHGTGFVEKLYDIASTVTSLLHGTAPLTGKLAQLARTNQWSDLLQNLHFFVARHRAGSPFAQPLAQAVALVPRARLLSAVG